MTHFVARLPLLIAGGALLLGLAATGVAANEAIDSLDAQSRAAIAAKGGNADVRVISGWPASEDYGWPVALTTPDGFQFCGGTLINATTVITAAHCVEFSSKDSMMVLHGTQKLDTGGTVVALAEDPIIHPRYSSQNIDYDVAIIKLADQLPGPYVTLASSRTDPAAEMPGSIARVIGWGVYDVDDPGTGSNNLLEGPQEIGSMGECRTRMLVWSPYLRMTDRMMCGFNTELTGGPCYGDSGGAFINKDSKGNWVQIGIVSWGFPGCESPEDMGIFSRVSAYEGWIADVLKPNADLAAIAEKYRDLDLDRIAFRRTLADARKFELAAYKGIEGVIVNELGQLPDPASVRISAQYLIENGENGGTKKLAILFNVPIEPGFSLAFVAMTEDASYYYYGGIIPYADQAYVVRSQTLHDWHPVAVMLNGIPYLFAYDNADFYFQPFSKDLKEELAMSLADRL